MKRFLCILFLSLCAFAFSAELHAQFKSEAFSQQYNADGAALSGGSIAFYDTGADKQAFSIRKVKIELDKVNGVFKVNGVDLLAKVKSLT